MYQSLCGVWVCLCMAGKDPDFVSKTEWNAHQTPPTTNWSLSVDPFVALCYGWCLKCNVKPCCNWAIHRKSQVLLYDFNWHTGGDYSEGDDREWNRFNSTQHLHKAIIVTWPESNGNIWTNGKNEPIIIIFFCHSFVLLLILSCTFTRTHNFSTGIFITISII